MADVNHVVVMGNLTRDSELAYTSGGSGVLKFSLANNRKMKIGGEWKDYTNYVDCVMFGKRAESLVRYFVKGTGLVVTGELHQGRWKNQEGQSRSKMEVRVSDFAFKGNRGGSGGSADGSQGESPYTANDGPGYDGGDGEFPDDIPF
jgi:single-strand DNA-binding protein